MIKTNNLRMMSFSNFVVKRSKFAPSRFLQKSSSSVPKISSISGFEDYADWQFETKCIHAGQEFDEVTGAVNVPIYQSSTFAQPIPGENYPADCMYTRLKNPTRTALEKCIASLEHGKTAIVAASGMGCTTQILMGLLRAGDHMISIDDVYGGANELFNNIISDLGIDVDFDPMDDLEKLQEKVTGNTKVVWLESPTNPTLRITDIQKVCHVVHEKNPDCIVVVDSTFASPYLQNPLLLGADIAFHSCTKYIGGHTDILGGVMVLKEDEESELYERLFESSKLVGAASSPLDCFLAIRGLKTLPIRMERTQDNAMQIAKFLEDHPNVEKVLYPGLDSHPQHELAKKQMSGFGGMITFYVDGDVDDTNEVLQNLHIWTLAVSLGGVESLAESPALMTHSGMEEEDRLALNITENLIRLSVGIENVKDLIDDLEQALNSI